MTEISVILPVYNSNLTHLRTAVQSVLSQSFSDFELIIVDDGSERNVAGLCDEFAAADSRIRVFHNSNQGPGKSRNFGIGQAKGNFIIFMDHDDHVASGWLEKLYHSIIDNEADAAFCYAGEFVDGSDEVEALPYPRFEREALSLNEKLRRRLSITFFPPWAKLVRRAFIEKYGLGFSEDFNRFDDVFFHLFVVHHARKISFVNEMLYFHRMFDGSISGRSRQNTDMYFDAFKTMDDVIAKCRKDGIDCRVILNRVMPMYGLGEEIVVSKEKFNRRLAEYIRTYKLDNVLFKRKLKAFKHWLFFCRFKKDWKILRIFGITLINSTGDRTAK